MVRAKRTVQSAVQHGGRRVWVRERRGNNDITGVLAKGEQLGYKQALNR